MKFTTKTGMTKIDFKLRFFVLNANKNAEVKTARNETKSPYQAKAMLDKTVVTKRMRKVLVLFRSGVLKSVIKAYAIPKIPKLSPIVSP